MGRTAISYESQLAEQIKANFALRSSAQLRQIVEGRDPDQWTVEAVAAASEVLRDRAAGVAVEPQNPVVDLPPPSPSHSPDSFAMIAGLNLLTLPLGFIVIPRVGSREEIEDTIAQDQPVPFGSNIAWLAVQTTETAQVAAALDLRGAYGQPSSSASTWEAGIEAANQSAIFVTPPLGEWTLAVSTGLFPPLEVEGFVKPLLERLSRQFKEAQYFCTHNGAGMRVWALARNGRLIRGFGYLDRERRNLWDEGTPTRSERNLGLPDAPAPSEDDVLQLASNWSIDPTMLDEHFKEPMLGLLGNRLSAAAEPSASG